MHFLVRINRGPLPDGELAAYSRRIAACLSCNGFCHANGDPIEAHNVAEASIGRLSQSNFDDVTDFHFKFDVPTSPVPAWLDLQAMQFRTRFLQEELDEFGEAYLDGDLNKAFDALLDLAYVAFGTAHMMGLPWQQGWDRVQDANMRKVRASSAYDARSTRKSTLDVVKPEGWKAPDHGDLVRPDDGKPVPTFVTADRALVYGPRPASAEQTDLERAQRAFVYGVDPGTVKPAEGL